VSTIRRRAIASGRVQGVFFRDSTRREASRRGVAGSAANLADGSVEVVLEGPVEEVEAMLEFLRRGPGHASVSSLDVFEEEAEGLSGFSVR
jgi:acylphosphatase